MPLPKFDYFVPKSLGEACSLLSRYKDEARVLAGGTDLLVKMKHRAIIPRYVVNIKSIAGLDYIHYDNREGLRIGALSTLEALKTSPVIRQRFDILSQAASVMGTAAMRSRGTIGGNLCNAAPSAETAPALITLGARVRVVGPGTERVIAIEDFFIGPGRTVLQPGEIFTEIMIPNPPPRSGGVYLKHSLRRMDIAIVGVGIIAILDGEVCSDIKIALGAVAPTPIRARKAEEVLRGKAIRDDLIEQAARVASEESRPIDDIRSHAEYRRRAVRILVKQAVDQAMKQARSGGS